jgi:hypothetical protein
MMKKQNTQRTRTELASLCGVSRPTLSLWRARGDWPGDDSPEHVLKTYAAKALERSKASQRGENADLKRAKLERQIELLKSQAKRAEADAGSAALRLKRERGAVVDVEHYRTTLCGVVGLSLSLWQNAIETISAKRKDAQLMEDLRSAMDRARQQVVDAWAVDEKRLEEMETEQNNKHGE